MGKSVSGQLGFPTDQDDHCREKKKFIPEQSVEMQFRRHLRAHPLSSNARRTHTHTSTLSGLNPIDALPLHLSAIASAGIWFKYNLAARHHFSLVRIPGMASISSMAAIIFSLETKAQALLKQGLSPFQSNLPWKSWCHFVLATLSEPARNSFFAASLLAPALAVFQKNCFRLLED